MANIPHEIQEKMNQVAYRYAGQFKSSVEAAIAKFSLTGKLKSSVKVNVIKAQGDNPPVIEVDFEEYGELIGKKKILWTKLPPVDKLKEFVEKKGLANKGNIPGYAGAADNLPEYKKVERIAWAIAKDKRKNDTHKPKRWKKEALPSVLRKLNAEVTEQFAAEVAKILAENISNKK